MFATFMGETRLAFLRSRTIVAVKLLLGVRLPLIGSKMIVFERKINTKDWLLLEK